jgi:hypothetical protein
MPDISIALSGKTASDDASPILPVATTTTSATEAPSVTEPLPYPGLPRWVKIFVALFLVGAAVFGVAHLGSVPHVVAHGTGDPPR